MKLGLFIPTATEYMGGGEMVPLMQAKYLALRKNIEVDLIVHNSKIRTDFFNTFYEENKDIINFQFIENKNISISNPELSHDKFHLLYLSLSRALGELCIERNYDYILSHYPPAVFGVPSHIKQLLLLHGVPSDMGFMTNAALHSVQKLLAVSTSVSEGWTKLSGINDIKVIHNGIDAKYFHNTNQVKDIDIFFVGRLIDIKGVQYLIEGIAKVKEYFIENKLRVVIGGKGPYGEILKELAKKLELEGTIEFVGYIPDVELLDYYNRSKVCVFPSYAREGVLTTMLEAAACENAIITSNCCGMVDFMKDGSNGLLVEPENSQDIADSLIKLFDNKNLITELGKQARKDILDQWTWERSAEKLENIILSLK